MKPAKTIPFLLAFLCFGPAFAQDTVSVAITSEPDRRVGYSLAEEIVFRVTTRYGFKVRPIAHATGESSWLTFELGDEDRKARCPAADKPVLGFTCAYVVKPGDLDTDGISVPTDALAGVNLAVGESTTDFFSRAGKTLRKALDDDPNHRVDAASCPGSEDDESEPIVASGQDMRSRGAQPTVQAGELGFDALVRGNRSASFSVSRSDRDRDYCMDFDVVATGRYEAVLDDLTADLDLVVCERSGSTCSRVAGGSSGNSGTADELVTVELSPGTFAACTRRQAGGDFRLLVRALVDEA